jgi:nucleoside-diphosphate-sugar epimerase
MIIGIIGCSGYIGSRLCNELSTAHVIHGFDIQCPSPNVNMACFRLLRGGSIDQEALNDCDVIIYLGGLSGRASCSVNTWGNVYNENVNDISIVLSKLHKHKLCIYASSASVLEGSCKEPATESYTIDETLMDSYALSMATREKVVTNINVNTVGLRFGTVIGVSPSQRYDLVHIAMLMSAECNGVIRVQNGECCRSILDMRDLVRAVKIIVEHKESVSGHRVYNLSSFNTTINNIARDIGDATGARVIDDVGSSNTAVGFLQSTCKFETDFAFRFQEDSSSLISHLVKHRDELVIKKNLLKDVHCRVCDSKNMMQIVDIGPQPLANNYVDSPCDQEKFPLVLVRCRECHHTQLSYTVDPSKMFSNYQYNSGTSQTLRNYFGFLAEKCITDVGRDRGVVVELACNDGSQLDEFAKRGWSTYGVDPAVNIGAIARGKGHTIYTAFWGQDEIKDLPKEIDVIVAQNVLAHVPDPTSFLKACANVMSNDTLLYIQTSQCNMLMNGDFDTIYHEHLSYFTVASLMKIADLCELDIVDLSKQPIHGTSFLCVLKKKSATKSHGLSFTCQSMLSMEKNMGLHEDAYYVNFMKRVINIKNEIGNAVRALQSQTYKVVAYGAAAKGMTLMNYFDLSAIEYIVDDAEMKHHKYTPGTNKLILPPQALSKETGKLCIVLFAWNFEEEIMKKMKQLLSPSMDVKVIVPFPQLVVKTLRA